MRRRVVATSLVIAAEESQAERRERRTAEAAIRRDIRRSARAERELKFEADRSARLASRAIPPGGERRDRALRTWRRFLVPTHRATTSSLKGLYLFQADSGLGVTSQLVGVEAYTRGSFTFDPWVLYQAGVVTNPNIVVAGDLGTGKSSLAKALVTRALPFGRKAYVPADVKGEWTPVVEACGGAAIMLGPGMPNRLNPLDEGVRPTGKNDHAWKQEVRARRLELLRSEAEVLGHRELDAAERTALAVALDRVCERTDEPLIPAVAAALFRPDPTRETPVGFADHDHLRETGNRVGHLLGSFVDGELAGMFDRPSTVKFDPTLPMVSLDISRLGENNPLLPLVMAATSSWMEAAVRDPAGGQRYMVHDEAWRTIREPSLLRRMQSEWKLSRHWGLSNIAIMHRLSDLAAVGDEGSAQRSLAEGLLGDTSVRIVYRQKPDQIGHVSQAMGLNSAEADLLPGLRRGEGLWRIGDDHSFVVETTLTDVERTLFDTDMRMATSEQVTPA